MHNNYLSLIYVFSSVFSHAWMDAKLGLQSTLKYSLSACPTDLKMRDIYLKLKDV